jgi:hypothetical protein
MPSLTVELSSHQLEEVRAYARRHQLTIEEVVWRALDRYLALDQMELGETDLLREKWDAAEHKRIDPLADDP